jgi:predicted nuclease of predicted toxin-antitoxin system
VKLLVDNQLPAALARFLASRGVDCQHVVDLDLGGATDAEIWEYASQNDCVVVSKDEDFLYLANARSAKARLIWIRSATAVRRRSLRQSSVYGQRSIPN